jgi:hypothetical protein
MPLTAGLLQRLAQAAGQAEVLEGAYRWGAYRQELDALHACK